MARQAQDKILRSEAFKKSGLEMLSGLIVKPIHNGQADINFIQKIYFYLPLPGSPSSSGVLSKEVPRLSRSPWRLTIVSWVRDMITRMSNPDNRIP